MKKKEWVSLAQIDAATRAAQREMSNLGLWNEETRLEQTAVVWCRLPQVVAADASGFFIHSSHPWMRLFGYDEGNIYIPQWVLLQGPFGQNRGSLRHVIRHEYGHAVAHWYPRLVRRSRIFNEVFGGRYDGGTVYEGNPDEYISDYAATMPAEDFAETFATFVRWKGNIPRKITNRALRKKFRFVAELCKRIEDGHLTW
jgi:hypothetical protein